MDTGTQVGLSNANEKGYSDVYLLPKASGETEKETARLELQHITFRLYNGNIFTAELPPNIGTVLDIGCGSGVWLRDFSALYPHAKLYGVDVNPPKVSKLPAFSSNIHFKKGNIEEPWTFAQDIGSIDYIFGRLLMTSIRHWDFVFAQAYQSLKPGGIIEMQETISDLYAEDGSTAETSPAIRWHQVVRLVLVKNGMDPDAATKLSPIFKHAGFEILEDKENRWNTFAKPGDGEREKGVAINFKQALVNLFDMMTPKLFAQADIGDEERSILALKAKEDIMQNSAKRGFYAVKRIHIARKPTST